jgi:hypothetical protein
VILTVRATVRALPAWSVAVILIRATVLRRCESAFRTIRLVRLESLSRSLAVTPAASVRRARLKASDLRPLGRAIFPEPVSVQRSSHLTRSTTAPVRNAR